MLRLMLVVYVLSVLVCGSLASSVVSDECKLSTVIFMEDIHRDDYDDVRSITMHLASEFELTMGELFVWPSAWPSGRFRTNFTNARRFHIMSSEERSQFWRNYNQSNELHGGLGVLYGGLPKVPPATFQKVAIIVTPRKHEATESYRNADDEYTEKLLNDGFEVFFLVLWIPLNVNIESLEDHSVVKLAKKTGNPLANITAKDIRSGDYSAIDRMMEDINNKLFTCGTEVPDGFRAEELVYGKKPGSTRGVVCEGTTHGNPTHNSTNGVYAYMDNELHLSIKQTCKCGNWARVPQCVEVTECESEFCVKSHTKICRQYDHRMYCECHEGFSGDICQDDVDECKSSQNLCIHKSYSHCKNHSGGYSCDCENNYVEDGDACVEACTIPLPLRNMVDYSQCELHETDHLVAVSQCQLGCAPGYEGRVDAACPYPGFDFDMTVQCKELFCAGLPQLPYAKLAESEDKSRQPDSYGFRNGAEVVFECVGAPDFYFDAEARIRRQHMRCVTTDDGGPVWLAVNSTVSKPWCRKVLPLVFKPDAASLPSDWRVSLELELQHKYGSTQVSTEAFKQADANRDHQAVNPSFKVIRGSEAPTGRGASIVSGDPAFWEAIFAQWIAEDDVVKESMLKQFVNPVCASSDSDWGSWSLCYGYDAHVDLSIRVPAGGSGSRSANDTFSCERNRTRAPFEVGSPAANPNAGCIKMEIEQCTCTSRANIKEEKSEDTPSSDVPWLYVILAGCILTWFLFFYVAYRKEWCTCCACCRQKPPPPPARNSTTTYSTHSHSGDPMIVRSRGRESVSAMHIGVPAGVIDEHSREAGCDQEEREKIFSAST